MMIKPAFFQSSVLELGEASLPKAERNIVSIETNLYILKSEQRTFTERDYILDSPSTPISTSGTVFTVTLKKEHKLGELMKELLGAANGNKLISEFGRGCISSVDVSSHMEYMAPETSQTVLLLDSNNRYKDVPGQRLVKVNGREIMEPVSSQSKYFQSLGLFFADDLEATIVCAALVNRAKTQGVDFSLKASTWENEGNTKFTKNELEFLKVLRNGLVRTSRGSLQIADDGWLHRHESRHDMASSFRWALARLTIHPGDEIERGMKYKAYLYSMMQQDGTPTSSSSA